MHRQTTASVIMELAPTGVLRAALNVGNTVLAGSNTSPEVPAGVTIDLSRELAGSLGVKVELISFKTAADALAVLQAGRADIGFMAIDPLRAEDLHFTSAYVQIEGCYAVPCDSLITSNEEVDRDGIGVVVGSGSAYDLFLTRHLKQASILRIPYSEDVVKVMLEGKHPVSAGVKNQLEEEIRRARGARLLPGRFMMIYQACCLPAHRGREAREYLDAFIRRMKTNGFVQDALRRHGIVGVEVAA
jgi:polar amino acid transport system substrate-binding protein